MTRGLARRQASSAAEEGLLHDLFDRRVAVVDRDDAALAERAHPARAGLAAEVGGRDAVDHHLLQLVVEEEDLEQPLPTFITRVVATLATFAVVELLAADELRRELELEELLLA